MIAAFAAPPPFLVFLHDRYLGCACPAAFSPPPAALSPSLVPGHDRCLAPCAALSAFLSCLPPSYPCVVPAGRLWGAERIRPWLPSAPALVSALESLPLLHPPFTAAAALSPTLVSLHDRCRCSSHHSLRCPCCLACLLTLASFTAFAAPAALSAFAALSLQGTSNMPLGRLQNTKAPANFAPKLQKKLNNYLMRLLKRYKN